MKDVRFADEEEASDALPDGFEPYVKEWFNDQFPGLSPPQRYSFDLIHEDENSLVCAPTGSGKCVKPGTELLVKQDGEASVVTAEEVWRGRKSKVADVDEDGELHETGYQSFSLSDDDTVQNRDARVFSETYSGDMYRFETQHGREVEVTPEHPLLVKTESGKEWRKAKEVHTGDRIAAPDSIDLPQREIRLDRSQALKALSDRFRRVLTNEDIKAVRSRILSTDSLDQISRDNLKSALAVLDISYSDLASEASVGISTVHGLVHHETNHGSEKVLELLQQKLQGLKPKSDTVVVEKENGEISVLRCPEVLDEELAELTAFVLAEGNIREYDDTISLTVSQKNRERMLKDLLDTFSDRFNVDLNRRNHEDYALYDSPAALLISELLQIERGVGRDVAFPSWLLNAEKNIKRSFVSTFLSLEAELDHSGIRLVQSNKRKIEQLNYVFLSMDIFPALGKRTSYESNSDAQAERTYHRLSISGIPNLMKLLEKLSIEHPNLDRIRNHIQSETPGQHIDKYRFDYSRIRDLSELYGNSQEFDEAVGNIYEVVKRTDHITENAAQKLLSELGELPNCDKTRDLRSDLQRLLSQQVTWLKVTEKQQETYEGRIIDLSVPGPRNYIGGSGGLYLHNTLSAFLSALNELFARGRKGELQDEIQVLYISPLRALSNDISRNLEDPLEGIREKAEEMGYDVPEIRSAVRTGDTTDNEKRKMRENPPHIMITTPESLGIIINSPKFRENFRNVEYTIIDEIHSLCENKRGVHLSLSMERLQEMTNTDITRIGLSATQAPIDEIAKYLVGYEEDVSTWQEETERGDEVTVSSPASEFESRGCTIVDVAASKEIDLETVSPVDDLIYTPKDEVREAMYEEMHDLIQEHESTIIFTNTRSATERVVNNLKDTYPESYGDNIGAHHSSMSREKRLNVEEKLKQGEMKVGVTSTSLELGVDIGTVELVLQLGSPKGVARGIQRVGRSGHQIGEKAKGKMIVTDRDDAMECSVLTKCAKEDNLDRIRMPTRCLDVLAQHVVGMACNHKWGVDHAFNVVRRSYNYVDLDMDDWEAVLKYLAGEYELEDQNVYRKIWRNNGFFGRSGGKTRMIYMTNIGTIPDESGYTVMDRASGEPVGDLDEEFLDRLTKGDIFTLGGKTFEFRYAKGMKVYVDSKPNAKPTVPSWYSERLPLSFDLGTRIGEFREQVAEQLEMGAGEESIVDWIKHNYYLDDNTAQAIYSYIEEQYRFMGQVSDTDDIIVERYIDEENRQNLIFQTIYGRRVHDALSRVLANILQRRLSANIGIIVDDNGFILVTPRRPVDVDGLLTELKDTDIEEELTEAVRKTELMKRRFRHVAGRSLMILRNYQGDSKTVGQQQMKGHFLISAIRNRYGDDFPMVKETYREIMEDAMDIHHAEQVLDGLREGEKTVEVKKSDVPSPFSHGLILQGSSDVMRVEDKQERLEQLHEQVMERIED